MARPNLAAIDRIAVTPDVDCATTIKPSQLGLDWGVDPCWRTVEPIVAAAAAHGVRVEIDVEDHAHVQGTLEILRRSVEVHADVAVAMQAYLHRTVSDVFSLPHGVRVLDVGLNGILVTPAEKKRTFVLYAEPWVQPMNHPIVVLAKREERNTDHAAKSVLLKVEK